MHYIYPEHFRPIPDFLGYYLHARETPEEGQPTVRIWSDKSRRFLTINEARSMKEKLYCKVSLRNSDSKSCGLFVHRLVAMVYIPNPENKPTVNHKDRQIYNNSISNLEWATNREQVVHMIETGRNHHKGTAVVCRTKDGEEIEYESTQIASQILGFARPTITEWILGTRCPSDGSTWFYAGQADLDTEEWKTLKVGDKELEEYQVSTHGRVKKKGRLLKGCIRNGYHVHYVGGKEHKTHRLVLFTFRGGPPSTGMTVDHIDRNPLNNHLSNLRWATLYEQGANKNNSKRVVMYDLVGNKLKTFETAMEAMRELGRRGTGTWIGEACRGTAKTAYGYRWAVEGEPLKQVKPHARSKPVIMFDLKGKELRRFTSVKDAISFLGKNFKYSSIYDACQKRSKTAYGYKWSY